MQGGREDLSDNYVMGEGVQSKNVKWGRVVLHSISILKIEAKTTKICKGGGRGPTHNCVMREGGGVQYKNIK